MPEDTTNREDINAKLTSSIEEIASSTQTVYEAVEQVAKSASALAKAGQDSSMLLLRRPAPVNRAADLLSWQRKSGNWLSSLAKRRKKFSLR